MHNKISRGIIVKALDKRLVPIYPILSGMHDPKMFLHANEIFSGMNLAAALDVRVGDIVKLVSPR